MISNKCHYALRALVELAKREGAGPATITEIAQAQNIPARFLEAILRQLKQAGMTESIRGKRGGYALARSAREITMGDVIRLIEGPPFIRQEPNSGPAEPPHPDIFEPIWEEAKDAINAVYDSKNLADLAAKEREQAMNYVPDYVI